MLSLLLQRLSFLHSIFSILLTVLLLGLSPGVTAALIDFEGSFDGATINTAEPGIQFTTTQGQDWIYGDWRTGNYNGPYPDGSYYSFGNFFAWLGPNQGIGRIDFDIDVAKKVVARYSSFSTVKLEGYDAAGNLLVQDTGGGNLDTGAMGTLEIEEPGIAYVFVHDSANYWLIDNLEFELADVELLEVDLQEDANETEHRTDDYDSVVFRRGQELMINVLLTPGYDPDYYNLSLIFKDSAGTKNVAVPGSDFDATNWVVEVGQPEDKSWLPFFDFDDYVVVPVKVFVPYDLPIDQFEVIARIQRSSGAGTPEELAAEDPVYFIFNPWSPMDDDVYDAGMSDAEREAYVLNERGTIFVAESASSKRWNFGQFDDTVFETTFNKVLSLSATERAQAWAVARYLTDIANLAGTDSNGGILIGRWDGNYSDGVEPTSWSNSRSIFRSYERSGAVKYGQCWVFGGITTSMSRSLGIPSRVITNIGSAHDTKPLDGVITLYTGANPEDRDSESIWNFHVWNEAYLSRPDRGGYSAIAWQAYDGTPQELSSGIFQTGPAPVAAVKANAGGSYDVEFIHYEVQADVEEWSYNPFDNMYEVVNDWEYRSDQMPTQNASGNKLDRLNDYCLDCASGAFLEQKLQAVSGNLAYVFDRSISFVIPKAHAAGLPGVHEVEIFSNATVVPGGQAVGTVVITNTGVVDDLVNVIVYLKARSSNGQTIEEWDEQQYVGVSISGGDSETLNFALNVPASTKALPGFDAFAVEAVVFGNEGNGAGTYLGEIAGADLSLSALEVDEEGRTTITATVTNVMPNSMQGAQLTIGTPEEVDILDPLVVTVGDLAAGASSQGEWAVQIPVGEFDITVGASADGLATVYDTIELSLAGPAKLRVLLDYSEIIALGANTDVSVSVVNSGGARVQDIDLSFSAGAGLGGGASSLQIAELDAGESQEYMIEVTGAEVGSHGMSAIATANHDGSILSSHVTGIISVQAGTTLAEISVDPVSIPGNQLGDANLIVSTDAGTNKEVVLSAIASNADKRYSVFDGTERILAQPVSVPAGGKVLTLRLEEPTSAGWIRVTATPTENPNGSSTAELEITGDEPLVIVDDRVSLSYDRTSYDRRTQSFVVPIYLENGDQGDLYGPVRIVISNLQPSEAELIEFDGTNPDGRPYFQALKDGEVWSAGETLPASMVKIHNPVRERIDFSTQVMAREEPNGN
ncbi:transglutaminase domain-containing protein [Thiohalocapsa sp. ML1]|uniref:transglutaminase domain-containing protein n=1 Tax=Thiohalocapsa sp. ML1 TaxID=1431688 RepID=UPI0007323436|nr:transglutaminase domain-containing protein [Thiohalocapsa sp. ML1]